MRFWQRLIVCIEHVHFPPHEPQRPQHDASNDTPHQELQYSPSDRVSATA